MVAKLKSRLGKDVILGIRPEDVNEQGGGQPGSTVSGIVNTVLPMGSEQYLSMSIEGEEVFFRLSKEHPHKDGDSISLTINRNRLHVFDKQSERSVLWD